MSATGAVKRDPVSGAIALRTHFDESNPQLAPMAWLIATVNTGPRTAPSTEVADWVDLYTPPAE